MSNDFVMDILNSAFQEQLDKFRAVNADMKL